MDYFLTEDQRGLQDSVARVLKRHNETYDLQQGDGLSIEALNELWHELVSLGLPALPIPEAFNGLNGTATDALVIAREVGRSLLTSPFTSTVLGVRALLSSSNKSLITELLSGIATGNQRVGWAHAEQGALQNAASIRTHAIVHDQQWRISGDKVTVLYADGSDYFIVSAKAKQNTSAAASDDVDFFLVDASDSGISMHPTTLLDGTPVCHITFNNALATPLAEYTTTHATASGVLADVTRHGVLLTCAEALGVAERAFESTCHYVTTRKQFGKNIGDNQAIRHRIADMKVSLEMCVSAVMLCAASVDNTGTLASCEADVSRAKWLVGTHGRAVCEAAVQLHGGMGIAMEGPVGRCLRKFLVLEQAFGDAYSHLNSLSSAVLEVEY